MPTEESNRVSEQAPARRRPVRRSRPRRRRGEQDGSVTTQQLQRGQGSPGNPRGRGRGQRPAVVGDVANDVGAVATDVPGLITAPGPSAASDAPLDQVFSDDESLSDGSLCAICCERMVVAAIGPCNHDSMCGACCLRMRMCYGDKSCPFCKTNMNQVVLIKRTSPAPFRFEDLMSRLSKQLWKDGSWAKGVHINKRQTLGGVTLPCYLQRMTSWSCKLCEGKDIDPFPSSKQLRHHLRCSHGRDFCEICLEAGRVFPLEQETFPDPKQRRQLPKNRFGPTMAQHMETHPSCEFCGIKFFDKELLYRHMQREHCTCYVCERAGIFFQYFVHSQDLLEHMRTSHYVCNEGHCANGFVGFATEEELATHAQNEHTGRMPRWNPNRSRPLVMDYLQRTVTVALGDQNERTRGRSARSNTRRQRNSNQPRGETEPGISDLHFVEPSEARASNSEVVDTSERFRLIDDNEFPDTLTASSAPPREANWIQRRPRGTEEDFPSLPSSHAMGPQGPVPRLITCRIECPCGRRTQFPVIVEGKLPPKVDCNSDCMRETRRSQLADAFGIDDSESYVPVAYRVQVKEIKFPLSLITWGRLDPQGVVKAESKILSFITDGKQQKLRIPVTTKSHRMGVETLAEAHGLATRNPGQYSVPYVEVLQTNFMVVPRPSLSQYARYLTDKEFQDMQEELRALSIHFVDVRPKANLHGYLRDWNGEYTLERDANTAVAMFKTKAAFDAAVSHLAGGRKGEFKIQKAGKTKSPKFEEVPSSTSGHSGQPGQGGWVAVSGNNRGWASVVRNQEELPDAWEEPQEAKKLDYLILKKKKRGGKESGDKAAGADEEDPHEMELSNQWKALTMG